MPIMTKARASGCAVKRPSLVVSAPKKPMMKEPVTLMKIVPQGKCGPNMRTADVRRPGAGNAADGAAKSDIEIGQHERSPFDRPVRTPLRSRG